MKKLTLSILSLIFLLCAAFGLVGCNEKHTHSFTEQKVEQQYLASAATCTEAAKYYYSCSCGEKGTQTFTSGNALGHSFTSYISDNNAACATDGTKTATCDRDGCNAKDTVTDTGSKLPHTFDKQIVAEKYLASEANCTEAANYYYSCSCGESEHDDNHIFASGMAKNHNYGTPVYTWSNDLSTCTAMRVCQNDGTHIETETATATATVTQQKSCTLDELSTYTAAFKNSAFATQTKEHIKTADKLNHDLTHHTAKAATCTEIGWYAYDTCTRCNYTTYKEISALNHNYSTEWTIDIQPTCTEAGKKSHHCTRCDSRSGVTKIEKLGHTYSEGWTQSETEHWHASTCGHTTESGRAKHTFDENKKCAVCAYVTTKPLGLELQSSVFDVDFKTKTAYLKVANAVEDYDFSDKFAVADGARFDVCTDKQCNNKIASKRTDLVVGDNVFYILITNEGDTEIYILTIRRRPIYTVSFNTNGGSVIQSQQVEEDDFAVEPADKATRDGYTFVSWIFDFSKPITKNITIVANWHTVTYSILYELNGGTNNDSNPTEYTVVSEIVLKFPSKLGYVFGGWYTSNSYKENEQVKAIDEGTFGNVKLFAKWTPSTYSVKFNKNNSKATGTMENQLLTYDSAANLNANQFVLTGYTFVGWTTEADGKGTFYTDKQEVVNLLSEQNAILNVYAKWNVNQYTISFVSNGGSNVDSITQDYGSTVTAPTKPTWNEKSFVGWFTDSSLKNEYRFTTIPAENITLYAKWIEYSVSLSSDETTEISINDVVTSPDTYHATAIDTDGNPVNVVVTVIGGTFEAGKTVTVRLVATGLNGIYATKTISNIKVYGTPTLSYNNEKDYFNLSDTLNAALWNANAADTFGTALIVSVSVKETNYSAGDRVTIVISATDITGNEAKVEIANVKVYGAPTITRDTTKNDMKATDTVGNELFGVSAVDSFGESLTVTTVKQSGTISGGNTITIKSSATDSKGNTHYITYTIKLYGLPTIGGATKTSFKVGDMITLDTLGIVAKDSFNNRLSNVTLTLTEGVQTAGQTLTYLVTATDHLGNVQTRTIDGIRIYGTPTISFDNEKTSMKVTDAVNANFLSAVAKDSHNGNLPVTVTVESGTIAGGNVVNFRLFAVDALGNEYSIVTQDIKVYSSEDIILTYNAAATTRIKKTSRGEEFEASAVNGFGETCTISIQPAQGYTLAGGNTINLYIVATDALGNTTKSALISGIKVYDTPTLTYAREYPYIQNGDSPYALFSVKDSFGAEVLFDVTIVSGSLDVNETIIYKITATDRTGNNFEETRELVVLDADQSILELYFNGEYLGTKRIYKGENYSLRCDVGYDTVWKLGGVAITDKNGNALTAWNKDSNGYVIRTTAVIKTYRINYDLDGGTNSPYNPSTYNIKNKDIVIYAPTKTGYTFLGWSGTDLDGLQMQFTIPTGSIEDRTYTANWSLNTYSISYILNNGQIDDGANPTSYTYEDDITLINPTREYHRFLGWYDGDTSVTCLHHNYHKDMTLVAKWECAFTLSGNTLTGVTSYGKTLSSLSIPSNLEGTAITAIGASAFKGCTNFASITIPDSVTSIDIWAFEDCSGLKSITIPDGITWIGSSVFKGCDNLKYNEYGNAQYLGNNDNPYVVLVKAKTTAITSCEINKKTKIIYGSAFRDCTGLKSIVIPDGVTWIGTGVFSDCSNLKYNEYENALYLGNNSNPYVVLVKAKTTAITSCKINNKTKIIYGSAFEGCSGLTSVTIGNGVTSIGREAFRGCSGLTSVTIPDSVTSIGYYAFEGCSGLTSVTIGNGVTSIGTGVFSDCNNLKYNEYENALYLGNNSNPYVVLVKAKTTAITSCVINNKTKIIYGYAFEGCSGLTSIAIPDSVISIGDSAFNGCKGIASITVANDNKKYHSDRNCLIEIDSKKLVLGCKNSDIPTDGSVTSIGDSAFRGCSGLTSITIPDGVTSIGSYAFYNCSGLTSITIPDSAISIGEFAFSYCSGLTSVTIGNGVTSIGSYAFYDCTGLKSIIIPDSVTWIGTGVFSGCNNLKYNEYENALYLGNNGNPYVVLVKAKTTSITSCVINNKTKIIYNYAFEGCSELASITIPNGVTRIGSSVFSGCSILTTIKFNGTKAQWNAISKGGDWNYNTGKYTIYCTDGNITK